MTTCIRRPNSVWTTCKCDPCRLEMRRKGKLARHGYYKRVPADVAWDVIDELRERGWSGHAIASAAGLSKYTVERALQDATTAGKRTALGPRTARAIVNHNGRPTEGTVGVLGARRRLQGLARQGYDLETLADMTGIGFSTLAAIRNGGTTKRVRARFHNIIESTVDEIGLQVGPSKAATKHAIQQGWVSLLAWGDIDHPASTPTRSTEPTGRKLYVDHAAVLRRLGGDKDVRVNTAEAREVIRRAYKEGRSVAWVEKHLGLNTRRYLTQEEWRREQGITAA